MAGDGPSLFESQAPRPLADRLRPARLADVIGQDHLLSADGPIGRMAAARRVVSTVLWGPPGSGKTTIARLLADVSEMHFEPLSAVFSGVADLRRIFEAARGRRAAGQGTLLFVDEIHRFNRAQQDGFLPYVEDGTVTLVGATTENPSFELNGALLSRCQVLVLHRLGDAALFARLNDAAVPVGIEGIQEVTGRTFGELMIDYAQAVSLTGTGAPELAGVPRFSTYDMTAMNYYGFSYVLQNGRFPYPVTTTGTGPSAQRWMPLAESTTITGPIGRDGGIRIHDFRAERAGDQATIRVSAPDHVRLIVTWLPGQR